MPVPQEIKDKKPTEFGAVEVRCLNGYYYVYLVSSYWNVEKKKVRKKTGKCIGKITGADGFIPNANGMRIMQNKKKYGVPHVRNYGAYEVMRQLSPAIEEKLREFFPDVFREIRTISLIRLVDGITSAKMMQPIFLDSYMADTCPDLAMSENTVQKFVAELGTKQDLIEEFMKSSILPGATLIFDGTSIFTRSGDCLSERGYNPNHKQNPQARMIYIFERDTHKPLFYRIVQGSVVDKSAFMDTVRDAGCKDCVIIADKGFYSKPNVSALLEANMKFILPLQDNTTCVPQSFYDNPDESKFQGVFAYHKRIIWYHKQKSGINGNYIYTFKDDIRQSELRCHFIERAEKENGEELMKPMDVLSEKRMGYFSFCSNLDISPEELYIEYKKRWDIEDGFAYLKHSVKGTGSYAHNDKYFPGWAFLNHISLLYFYGLVNAVKTINCEKTLTETYSPEDVIKLTKNIYLVDEGDSAEARLSVIQTKTQDLLDALGINLLRKN